MKRNLSFVMSIFLVLIYIIFAVLAFINFPGSYSPLRNWLSDLGSFQLNPGGAIFYNLGISLTGAALVPFFLGLGVWAKAGLKKQKVMLLLTQTCGCLGAFAMVLSAAFPISVKGVHSFLSAALYILVGTAFAFSVAALRYYPRYPRWLLAVGVLVAIEDMIWSVALNTFPMEWLTVFLFLGYVLLVGLQTNKRMVVVGEPPH